MGDLPGSQNRLTICRLRANRYAIANPNWREFTSGCGTRSFVLVVAGLVPATPIVLAQCLGVRRRRDKPRHDGR